MSGTNIFAHVSDEAKYVYLQPFTSPGAAFESGGDVQSLIEQINPAALQPLPVLPIATTFDTGSVEYSTQEEANGLEDLTTVITPMTLNGVDEFVSPSTETQLGNMKEISLADIHRDTDTSNDADNISLRRFVDYLGIRDAYDDDGDVRSNGFVRLATIDETNDLLHDLAITPIRTWNLIKAQIPDPWPWATELESGVVQAISPRNSLKIDKTLAITVNGLNNTQASTSKKGAFRLADVDNTTDADVIITAGTIDKFIASTTTPGFFDFSSTIENDDRKTLTAAQGVELNTLLGTNGGTVTGTIYCDNIYAVNTSRVKVSTAGGGYYYKDQTLTYELFPNNQLSAKAGLAGRPVGSIFHTTSSKNPGSIFGGTWYRVTGGQTMLGQGTGHDGRRSRSFSAGSSGNDNRIRLTEAHLPSHKHAQWGETYSTRNGSCKRYVSYPWFFGYLNTQRCVEYNTVPYWQFGLTGSRNHYGMGSTDQDNFLYYGEPVGGNGYHENMMPYYTVYIWRRVK